MIYDILDGKTINNIKRDTLQFGIALLLSQIFGGEELEKSIIPILLTLLGFAVYQAIIAKIYITDNLDPTIRITLNDLIKFGIMLFISKLLLDRGDLISKEFILSLINILIGFYSYNTLISKNVTVNMLHPDMKFNEIMAVNDLVKYTYVLVFAGFLNQISGIGQFDKEYKNLTIGYVTGIVFYDLFIA
jgi:hypothetical protein